MTTRPGGNNILSFRWVREAATNIGEEWEDGLSLPENVEVENDEGDQVFNFNWTKVIGARATNELKVSHVREILHSGNTEYFDDDFNYIELNGRDQFDVGSANEHPDFLAGPGAIHGSAEIRTYIVDDAFTFFKSGWHGTIPSRSARSTAAIRRPRQSSAATTTAPSNS